MSNHFDEFIARISSVEEHARGKFGQMNAHQMLVHCADQLRLALGQIESIPGELAPDVVITMAREGKTVPTPPGLDKVKGEGTPLTSFENDKILLIALLKEFDSSPEEAHYGDHPYFGPKGKSSWSKLVVYHLDHHLSQFGA